MTNLFMTTRNSYWRFRCFSAYNKTLIVNEINPRSVSLDEPLYFTNGSRLLARQNTALDESSKFKAKVLSYQNRGARSHVERETVTIVSEIFFVVFLPKNFFLHHFSFLSPEIIHSARFFRHNNGKSFQIDMSTSCHEIKHASTGHGTPPPRHAGFLRSLSLFLQAAWSEAFPHTRQ